MTRTQNGQILTNLSSRPLPEPSRNKSQRLQTGQLHGFWLRLVQSLWLCIVVPAYILLVANIPALFASLHVLHASGARVFTGQLSFDDLRALQTLGLSLDVYAALLVGFTLFFQLCYACIGVLLFWRRPDTRVAIFISFALMMLPFGFANITLQALPADWSWLVRTVSALGNCGLLLCAFVFPDGRYVPSWTRWLVLLMLVYWGAFVIFPSMGIDRSIISLALFFCFVLLAIALQLYRYRYVSRPKQQQQTKWALLGVTIAVVGNILPRLLYYLVLLPVWHGSSLAYALEVCLIMVMMLAIPFTLGIAILRYRLWDIDHIINRALVYSTLTATLGLIYIGLVLVQQLLLRDFIQQTNDLVLVASTLIVAALFQPLRRRIQTIIDRRFYRQKYDAARTLEAFGTVIRNEVELARLSDHLLAVVQETMQPEHVSLWLRDVEAPEPRKTRLLPRISENN